MHRHEGHEERIDVVEGEIEVTSDGVRRRLGVGEHIVITRGALHAWRNPTPDRRLRFRG